MTCKDCIHYVFGITKELPNARHYCRVVDKYVLLSRKELKQLANHCRRFVQKLSVESNNTKNEQ